MNALDDQLLNERAVAARLNISPRKVREWRVTGGGPPFVRLPGRLIRYPAAALNVWIAELRTEPPTDTTNASAT